MKSTLTWKDMPAPSDTLYRYTTRLLKHYRDYCWQLKVFSDRACALSGVPLTGDTLLPPVSICQETDADYAGELAQLQDQICLLSSFLSTIDHFSELIHQYHPYGEQYYWILYYTYFSAHVSECTDEILELLAEKGLMIPMRSYFRKRRNAIELLATLLAQKKELWKPA